MRLGSRPILAVALLCAALCVTPRSGQAELEPGDPNERIRSFASDIELARDDAFTVVETIDYDFGTARRHGIFRRIPISYGRGVAADYSIALDVESVDDGAGHALPYRVSYEGSDVIVRIGDANEFVSGQHTYRIRYRVRRGLLYFDEHDELYWNATGTEWDVPIDAARATVRLPEAVPSSELRLGCFTGRQSSVEHDCSARDEDGGSEAAFATTRPLGAREGLTIVVGLPKGVVHEPSTFERILSRARDWWTAFYLVPIGVLLGMVYLWRRHGRDPTHGHAVTVRYEPPEGMTPAEMGTVLDESADMSDVTATILDLAVHGHLRIEEKTSTKFLFLTDRDYELVRLESKAPLDPFAGKLLEELFAGQGTSVLVSELKNKFYRKLPGLRTALYDAAISKQWFASSPQRVRTAWKIGAGALGVAAFLALMVGGSFVYAIPFVLAALIVLGFARAMPQRTKKGRQAYEEILGFQEFVQRVDRDRLERSGGRTEERFERILPFAVVLGLADEWADGFADVYTQPPDWYAGSRGPFDSRVFVSRIGRSMGSIAGAMASQPRSSGSGRSGFSGGSSGGGFGGGGGGSW